MHKLKSSYVKGLKATTLVVGGLGVLVNLLLPIFEVFGVEAGSDTAWEIVGLVTALLVAVFIAVVVREFTTLRTQVVGRRSVQKVELIRDRNTLKETMCAIVDTADGLLLTSGSRSSEQAYLDGIEAWADSVAKGDIPESTYRRVLHGPPQTDELEVHLENLNTISRRPSARFKMEIFDAGTQEERWYVCANSSEAVIVLPSLSGAGRFDTAIHFKEPKHAAALQEIVCKDTRPVSDWKTNP